MPCLCQRDTAGGAQKRHSRRVRVGMQIAYLLTFNMTDAWD